MKPLKKFELTEVSSVLKIVVGPRWVAAGEVHAEAVGVRLRHDTVLPLLYQEEPGFGNGSPENLGKTSEFRQVRPHLTPLYGRLDKDKTRFKFAGQATLWGFRLK